MSSAGSRVVVEGAPDDDQKRRLEDFLTELMLITRRYRILLVDDHETLQFQDMLTGNLIGLGVVAFTAIGDPRRVLSYLAADSILDGVWNVDTDAGPKEQHVVGAVFPYEEGE